MLVKARAVCNTRRHHGRLPEDKVAITRQMEALDVNPRMVGLSLDLALRDPDQGPGHHS